MFKSQMIMRTPRDIYFSNNTKRSSFLGNMDSRKVPPELNQVKTSFYAKHLIRGISAKVNVIDRKTIYTQSITTTDFTALNIFASLRKGCAGLEEIFPKK